MHARGRKKQKKSRRWPDVYKLYNSPHLHRKVKRKVCLEAPPLSRHVDMCITPENSAGERPKMLFGLGSEKWKNDVNRSGNVSESAEIQAL